MVKVASVLGATGLALFIREGIDRPLLPSTAALLRKRAWLGRREVSPGATGPTALGRRVASRENILASGMRRVVRMIVETLVHCKRSYADRALHRWSNKFLVSNEAVSQARPWERADLRDNPSRKPC